MIGRLSAHPTRRLALRSTILAGTSSVLMSPAHRRVHAHLPADPAHGIGRCLGAGDHLHPSAIPLPAPEQPINGLPRPITGRHIPPRRPRPHPPADPVNQLPAPQSRPATPRRVRQHPLQSSPLLIGQITPAHSKIISAQRHPETNF